MTVNKTTEEPQGIGTIVSLRIEKEWRPEGYENPYHPSLWQINPATRNVSKGGHCMSALALMSRQEGYDEGYDAAIKALRAEALMYRHGDPDKFISNTGVINFDKGDRGHLVFIPGEPIE